MGIFRAINRHPKFTMGTISSVLLSAVVVVYINSASVEGAKGTIDPIDAKIDSMTIEEGVAQLLMVGIDSDHVNHKKSSHFKDQISGLGVGFAIMNTYNYHNSDEYDERYVRSLAEFNAEAQFASLISKSRLPILIATDYEGPSYSSIRGGLTLPPSALSMGASQNVELIKCTGKLVGKELSGIGIHLILGPVVDTYHIKQGNKSTLQDRCFSSSTQGSICLASHYIEGLIEGKLGAIIKHVPSYGTVESNPHDYNMPEFKGAESSLKAEIEAVSKLRNSVSGIMTSHMELKFLQSEKFATFSRDFVKGMLNDIGNSNSIIITDDLTSMGAILKYKNDNKLSYSRIAVDAFSAGHNVLLFSHFKRYNPKSDFDMSELTKVIKSLVEYVKSDKTAYQHYKNSLRKVIALKVAIGKLNGREQDDVIGNTPKPITNYDKRPVDYKAEAEKFLQDTSPSFPKTGASLISELIKSGATEINKTISYDIFKLPKKSKIVFCVPEEHVSTYKSAFADMLDAVYIGLPKVKNTNIYKDAKNSISRLYGNIDCIVYGATDISDADFLASLYLRHKDFPQKVVILCFGNPIMFDDSLLSNTTMIAFFTNHQSAIPISVEILKGSFRPRLPNRLPINLGDGSKFLQATSVWPECSNILTTPIVSTPATDRTAEAINYLSRTHYVFSKRWEYILVIIPLAVFAIALRKFMISYFRRLSDTGSTDNIQLSIMELHNYIPPLLAILLFAIYVIGLGAMTQYARDLASLIKSLKFWKS